MYRLSPVPLLLCHCASQARETRLCGGRGRGERRERQGRDARYRGNRGRRDTSRLYGIICYA